MHAQTGDQVLSEDQGTVPVSIVGVSAYLGLHQQGHVHEHGAQLSDAGLQANDVLVAGLDLAQGLTRDLRI